MERGKRNGAVLPSVGIAGSSAGAEGSLGASPLGHPGKVLSSGLLLLGKIGDFPLFS